MNLISSSDAVLKEEATKELAGTLVRAAFVSVRLNADCPFVVSRLDDPFDLGSPLLAFCSRSIT